jgi:hypothetical protein
MEMSRIKQLAGMQHNSTEGEVSLYKQLNEVVEIPGDITVGELVQRLDACKRALSIVSKMQDPADKKKWMSATFVNLNKVRGAMQRMMKQMGITDPADAPYVPGPATSGTPNGDGKFMIGDARI